MLLLINQSNAHHYWPILASMHHLRRRVFLERLGWNVRVINGLELDQFDLAEAHYLVRVNADGTVDACTRLLPTTGPYLLGDVFPHLVDGAVPHDPGVWESTRFCADTEAGPSNAAGLLMAGMLEFGLHIGLRAFVSVSDVRMEPIMRRAGWPPVRLGGTMQTGTDVAAAEWLDVDREIYMRVRMKCGATTHVISNLHTIDFPQVAA